MIKNMILMSHDKTKLLLLQRANYMKKFGGKWGFAGGQLDKNDKCLKDTAVRELLEETGIILTFNEIQGIKKIDCMWVSSSTLSRSLRTRNS